MTDTSDLNRAEGGPLTYKPLPVSDLDPPTRVYADDAMIMCGRRDFQLFLGADGAPETLRAINYECGVHSLLDIKFGRGPGFLWEELMQDFNEHVETEKSKRNSI